MKQRGFTLIEVLVTVGIIAVLMPVTVLSIYQISVGSIRDRNQMIALNDANFAVTHIKNDIEMAQTSTLTDGNPTPSSSVTFNWIEYARFESSGITLHSSTYTLVGTDLHRTYDGHMSIIGRHITSLGFTQTGKVVTATITATSPPPEQRSKTLTFSSRMRPDEMAQ